MGLLKTTYKQLLLDCPIANANIFKCFIAKYINPSYSVIYTYRLGFYLQHSKYRFLRLFASRKRMILIFKKNCDISFLSKIGVGLKMPHPIGIVIGAGSVLGDNVTIFQNVTLGSNGKKGNDKSYPIIEDGVIIYADSIIVGGIKIGENAIIGAKTLVNIDVPPNSLAVGIPCKIINNK